MSSFWIIISKKHHENLKEISIDLRKNKDEFLFIEEELFRGFYVVNSGRFRIFNSNKAGNEATISIMDPGSLISAVPILAGLSHYHSSCQAIENSSVTFFPKKKFVDLIMTEPELLFEFSKLVSGHFLKIREKYLSLILKTAEERFLDFLKKSDHHQNFAELNVSKKNIASLLDITPESLSRIISKLEKEGTIHTEKNKIKIIS